MLLPETGQNTDRNNIGKLQPLNVEQVNTLSLLGPGSIISPQNRQAITDAKNSARGAESARRSFNFQQKAEKAKHTGVTSMGLTSAVTEAASKIGGGTSHQASHAVLLNRETSKTNSMMPSSLAKTQKEAGEILNRYGGLSGNLYTTSLGSRKAPHDSIGNEVAHSLGLGGTGMNSISELPANTVGASTARSPPRKERMFDSEKHNQEISAQKANEQPPANPSTGEDKPMS